MDLKKGFESLGQGIEEIILLGIIVLNIFDFTEQLSPTWDYAKKILSWTALGYLLYKASLTNIFFNQKMKGVDLALILSFFVLSFKNFIAYAKSTISDLSSKGFSEWGAKYSVNLSEIPHGTNIYNVGWGEYSNALQNNPSLFDGFANMLTINMSSHNPVNSLFVNITTDLGWQVLEIDTKYSIHRWLNFVIQNENFINNLCLIIGGIALIAIAIYCAFKVKITAPSIMHMVLHKEDFDDSKLGWWNITKRTVFIFLVFNCFFIIIFNLVMEWLAIAIDAPLLVVALFFYLLIWIKHHKRFNTEGMIYKLGNLGAEFYEHFMNLLKTRRGLLLGVSGMLVLHLLTEIGIFIIPYTIGIHDPLYLSNLPVVTHQPILSIFDFISPDKAGLMTNDILSVTPILDKLMVAFIYIQNHIAMLMILIVPASMWYLIFMSKRYVPKPWFLALFFSSMSCFLMARVFDLQSINSEHFVGVDIQTRALLGHGTTMFNLMPIVLVSLVVGILVYLIAYSDKVKENLINIAVTINIFTLAWYVLIFFIDISRQYFMAILYFFLNFNIFNGLYFTLFLFITMGFYIGGFVSYVYEIIKN